MSGWNFLSFHSMSFTFFEIYIFLGQFAGGLRSGSAAMVKIGRCGFLQPF